MDHYKLYLGGCWSEGIEGKVMKNLNPATGVPFALVHVATDADVDAAVSAAVSACIEWRQTGPSQREALLLKVADIMARRQGEIIPLLIEESGCNFGNAAYQVGYSIESARSAAGECRRICGETIPSDVPGLLSYTVREPLGVIAGIAPFNVPFVLAANKIDKAIAAGNSFILKPSEMTPISGILLAEIYEEAGAPPGLVSVLPGDGQIGIKLVQHPDVRMITFTGSTATGRKIAVAAAENFKKTAIEMGGKCPLVVLADCDLDYAVNTAIFSIFNHQGQVCMASSRIIVEEAIYPQFCEAFTARAAVLKVGDPTLPDTIIGPLINPKQCDFIDSQLEEAVAEGARLLSGGSHDGSYYTATVVCDIKPTMRIFNEESFGPVACLISAKDSTEALKLANASCYGLSAAVMTKDISTAMSMARGLQYGMVHINGSTIQCEPNIPFGGLKSSGVGREGGRFSIDEMTELKWVTIQEGQSSYPF
tara:strand:- start:3458 stop:4897 length:1440 start_codon:yes stop_codon:yes gene_type:complete